MVVLSNKKPNNSSKGALYKLKAPDEGVRCEQDKLGAKRKNKHNYV